MRFQKMGSAHHDEKNLGHSDPEIFLKRGDLYTMRKEDVEKIALPEPGLNGVMIHEVSHRGAKYIENFEEKLDLGNTLPCIGLT